MGGMSAQPERPVSLILIHCAATPNGRRVTVEDVDAWHRERGFQRSDAFRARQNPRLTSIGYHFLIYAGTVGAVATGRHLDEVGAHAQGFNQKSVGICLAGTNAFSPGQWESLRVLVQGMLEKYPNARIAGHRDLPKVAKTCPGFSVDDWVAGGMEPLPGHVLESA